MKAQRICKYKGCKKPLQPEVHGNRDFCDANHYYLEKLERSRERSAQMRAGEMEVRRNVAILAQYEKVSEINGGVDIALLEKEKFNFGLSEREGVILSKYLAKILRNYAYYIDYKNKKVLIWKLRQNQ